MTWRGDLNKKSCRDNLKTGIFGSILRKKLTKDRNTACKIPPQNTLEIMGLRVVLRDFLAGKKYST